MPNYEKGIWGIAIILLIVANTWMLWHLLLWADRHGYLNVLGR